MNKIIDDPSIVRKMNDAHYRYNAASIIFNSTEKTQIIRNDIYRFFDQIRLELKIEYENFKSGDEFKDNYKIIYDAMQEFFKNI